MERFVAAGIDPRRAAGLIQLIGLAALAVGLGFWLGWPVGLTAAGAGLYLDAILATNG